MMAKEKPPITVVGDVGGRIAIIVVRDDGEEWVGMVCFQRVSLSCTVPEGRRGCWCVVGM